MIIVQYQVFIEGSGWQDQKPNGEPTWRVNGQLAGTTGQSLRLEAIKIKLLNAPPNVTINYQVQVQNIGWENWVSDGQIAGAEMSGLRIEAIRIYIPNDPVGTGVIYQAHVQNVGWQEFVSNNAIAGTVLQSLRMEAIKIAPVVNPAPIAPYGY